MLVTVDLMEVVAAVELVNVVKLVEGSEESQ